MQFFSGFSLINESYLFKEFIDKSDYNVCGFSYGAIKALRYVNEELAKGNRVDRLQLLSPAFFQTKDAKFKKIQLISYKKNKDIYLNQFLNSCFRPYEKKIVENIETSIDELEELLTYEWLESELEAVAKKGVVIEVYLGGKDAIVDANDSKEFFIKHSTVTYIKEANHFLQIN